VDTRTRILVITVAVLLSVITGIAAALLKSGGTDHVADMILYGFAAFGATLGLILLVIQAFRSL
jgi:uncharacterized membrane protein